MYEKLYAAVDLKYVSCIHWRIKWNFKVNG